MDISKRGVIRLFGISALVPVPAVTALLTPLDEARPPVLLGEVDAIRLTYRGPGDWGAGKCAPLTATELDANFWVLHQRLQHVEELLARRST